MTTPVTPSTANASNPFASLKINHSAIRVPDFDTAIAWYAEKRYEGNPGQMEMSPGSN